MNDRDGARVLILLRHSKADRPTGVADLDRPLTARGHADAAAAGAWLARHGLPPDLVICSPSKRTRQTWQGMASALVAKTGQAPPVHYEPLAYDGAVADLLALARAADDPVRTLLVVGHNPGISLLSAMLDPVADGDSDGLRTSGLALHEVTGPWADLHPGTAHITDTHTARG
jgi:phosphohistidine phosphatase